MASPAPPACAAARAHRQILPFTAGISAVCRASRRRQLPEAAVGSRRTSSVAIGVEVFAARAAASASTCSRTSRSTKTAFWPQATKLTARKDAVAIQRDSFFMMQLLLSRHRMGRLLRLRVSGNACERGKLLGSFSSSRHGSPDGSLATIRRTGPRACRRPGSLTLRHSCLGGEIGRRAGLKIPFSNECRFESDPRHHSPMHRQPRCSRPARATCLHCPRSPRP